MPAGDFSPSVLPSILVETDSIFSGANQSRNAEFFFPGVTAKTFLENQSVQTQDILEGGVCKSVTAWFLEGGTTTLTYTGAVTNPAATCEIAACTEMQTQSKVYDKNLFVEACASAKGHRCDNAVGFAQEAAAAFLRARKDILKELNNRVLALLTANVQANQSTNYDSTLIGAATIAGNRLKMSPTNFQNLDNLVALDLLKYENIIPNPIYLNVGTNFYTAAQKAFFARNAPEAGTAFVSLQELAGGMKWDLEGRAQLGRNSTFILNPDAFLFFNTTYSDSTPILVNPSKNVWTYKMDDPELMYRKNGQMIPVQYEIEYSYVCSDRDSVGRMIFTHTWKVRLIGGLNLAPAGFAPLSTGTDTHPITGVMEIVAEA